jgi:hypothetical protein
VSGRAWTPEEDEILESMLGDQHTATIARRLGCTEARVNNRIARLGLSRKRLGVYSANELSLILGIEGSWIRDALLRTGILPMRWVQGRGRFGQSEVTEADLIAFLRAYPHLVDRDRVDAAYRQFVSERWVTTVEAFRRGACHPVVLEHAFHSGLVDEVRKRGQRWVIPESFLPRLVEGRRRSTDDTEHRRQVRMYERLQTRGTLRAMNRARPKLRRAS